LQKNKFTANTENTLNHTKDISTQHVTSFEYCLMLSLWIVVQGKMFQWMHSRLFS